MGKVLVSIRKGFKATAHLKLKDDEITHVGVYSKQNAIGWSRLYQHLWIQAISELGIPENVALHSYINSI